MRTRIVGGLSFVLITITGLILLAGTPANSDPSASAAPDDSPLSSCTNLENWQCVETRPGLSLCRANNICIVKVDLNNNSLRPRVVIAPNGGTEWLSTMAAGAGAYAAINGDYFNAAPGACPEPDDVPPLNCGEGLTYVDGVDYTDYTEAEWQNRRSLGFNDNYDPNIGWPSEQTGYHRQLLGGGPQITFGGEYRWRCWYQPYNTEGNCDCQGNTVVINDELFGCSANNWWNRPQTMAGFSDDRNTLYLAVSEPGVTKTPHEMHDVLWVLGGRYSIKQDGGGSSGMYFNDGGYQFSWNGDRSVANAWVVVPNSAPPTPTPTPSSNCNPSSNQIAIYANTDFGGVCVTLNIGDYPNPGYLSPVGNDNAESIRVGSATQAILCEHDNYQGQCETFTSDDSNLGDNPIGANRVSSARVQQRSQPTPTRTPSPTPTWTPSPTPVGTPRYTGPAYLPVVKRVRPAVATPTPTATPVSTGWITLINDGFEGSFPGPWDVSDEYANGEQYYFGKRSCRHQAGSWSAWAVGGGAQGSALPCSASYPNDAYSWMVYGPFSLQGATAAELTFQLNLNTELDYDYLCRAASADGYEFWGICTTGTTNGSWVAKTLDLTNVPELGNLTGRSTVWVALIFVSDFSITYPDGAHVDSALLRKFVPTYVGETPSEVAAQSEVFPPGIEEKVTSLHWDR